MNIKCKKTVKERFINRISKIKKFTPCKFSGKVYYTKFKNHTKKRGLAILAHYDKHNLIDETFKGFIRALGKENFDILIVSTSNLNLNIHRKFLEDFCIGVIVRENIGYDFLSYKIGYGFVKDYIQSYDIILFANDSTYLISDELFHQFMGNVYTKLFKDKFQCVGALSSCEKAYHLQSWFLAFKTSKKTLRFVDNFMEYIIPLRNKKSVINCYEIGISQMMLKNRMKIGAVFEYKDLLSKVPKSNIYYNFLKTNFVNPSHFMWNILIENDFPFIKRELLLKNPSKIVNIHKWKMLLRKIGSYEQISTIKSNLRRIDDES